MDTTDDVTALLDAFGQALHAEDARWNTVSAYRADVHHFLTWLFQTMDTCRLDEVTPTDIREYREFLQEQLPPATPATINRRLAALRRFFAWAKEQQLTDVQPTAHIRNVESTEHRPRSLDRKQWNRLQWCVGRATGKQGIHDRCLILLLYHTGVHAGELAALRLDDLTLGERSGQLNVRRGKGNKARLFRFRQMHVL